MPIKKKTDFSTLFLFLKNAPYISIIAHSLLISDILLTDAYL